MDFYTFNWKQIFSRSPVTSRSQHETLVLSDVHAHTRLRPTPLQKRLTLTVGTRALALDLR